MAWYKVDIQHGPGHQSRTVDYVWRDEPRPNHKEIFNEVAESWRLDWPIGTVRKVQELPQHVHRSLVEQHKHARGRAIKMLEVLARTPTAKPVPSA